jgi:hypothetical protein
MSFRTAVTAWIVLLSLTRIGLGASELKLLEKQASQFAETKEGQRYFDEFVKAIEPALNAAMDGCLDETPDTKDQHPAEFVFVIAADGRVKKMVYSIDIPFGRCIGPKLRAVSKLPRPPRDSWVVLIGASNHRHALLKSKGPPDQPRLLKGHDEVAAYEKAVAPHVAKARATYPAAKKRFLAGLPPGHKFSVRVSLFDRDGKRENSFVKVETIKNGQITGIVESTLGLIRDYKTGQRITFPEDKIDNWVILRPDGTEEGNYVGKFLDHYKPR